MEEQSEYLSDEEEASREPLSEYITVAAAARIIGVSSRSVYGYIDTGRLPGRRVGHLMLVREKDAHAFVRTAPGRLRKTAPDWHTPPLKNCQSLTTIIVRLRSGQEALLEQKLQAMRAENRHHLQGTAARYIARSEHDPNQVMIVLVWRSASLPSEEERAVALAAFVAEMVEALDWETAIRKESVVLLHA